MDGVESIMNEKSKESMDGKVMRVLSQNINKSLPATLLLKQRRDGKPTIMSIQEPNISFGEVRVLSGLKFVVPRTQEVTKPAVVCAYTAGMGAHYVIQMVTVIVSEPAKVALTCALWNKKKSLTEELIHMEKLTHKFCKMSWILIGDTNCKNTLWGDKLIDERGRKLGPIFEHSI